MLTAYSAVKEVISSCYFCKRENARPIQSNTNDYSDILVNPKQKFFQYCYVDYAGPYITEYGGSRVKTYLVIFKCVWSRMINVEIVTSADARTFLIAFQNHVYAYGLPSKLFFRFWE